ncbi:GGDEF domain-containing protein [Dyella amyloliquefaciens]|uniref:GGDEF domain-containing protein n=1 Tax=Dyella amyloliquefaciens TaxID=1770545 RepID=UPI00102ECB9D|nr:GGDEF domain-containing protein [Dyella amyloliquefaciens]
MPNSAPPYSSITQRFQSIVVTIYVLTLPLVVWALANQWMAYAAARDALQDLTTFRMTLDIMVDLSEERGATFRAFDDPSPTFLQRQARLGGVRGKVDANLERLRARFGHASCDSCEGMATDVNHVESALQEARQSANALLSKAPSERSSAQVSATFDRLAAVGPLVTSIAATNAPGVIRRDPEAVRYLYTAGFAALLRDSGGLLASQIARALATEHTLTPEENTRIEQTIGKINQLYTLVRSAVVRLPDLPSDLLAPVRDRYIGEDINYVAQVRAELTAGGASKPSATAFLDRYFPLMQPIVNIRDIALRLTEARLREDLVKQRALLVSIAVSILLLTVFIGVMTRQFHKQIVRPFVEARRSILAIATGDLSTTVARPAYEGEIHDLFDAIDALKENSRLRLQLEVERDLLLTELRELADTDPLTGLLNRRAFETRAERLLADRRNTDSYVVLTSFDIDHFKRINDTYGHETGDRALKRLAELCREAWRADDILGRIGGEEFAVLTTTKHPDQSQAPAQRVLDQLHQENIAAIDGRMFSMTVSFGVTVARKGDTPSLEALFRDADALLYRAKNSGRDRIEMGASS